jgi:nuclear GTP-binding protein
LQVWQYITLMRRIYLIDCPGIVPVSAHDSTTSTVLKGVVRVENLSTPSEHIPELLSRVRPEYIERTYGLPSKKVAGGEASPQWDADEFLEALARKGGRLLKGGEPDRETVSKMVLNDWIRGRIPFFVRPPEREEIKGSAPSKISASAKQIKGVEQPLAQIVVGTKFLGDDNQKLELPEVASAVEADGAQSDSDEGDEDDVDDELEQDAEAANDEPEQAELGWDEVFGAVSGKAPADNEWDGISSAVTKGKSRGMLWYSLVPFEMSSTISINPSASPSDDEDDDDDADNRRTQKKEPRMTTNKVTPLHTYK